MLDAILIFTGICSLLSLVVWLFLCCVSEETTYPIAVIAIIVFIGLLAEFLAEYDFVFTIVSKV